MGLRCSLLGHDFEEPEVEREREEQGSEVVVTVREVKECGRCGLNRTVTENKEVTAIRDAPTGERPADDADSGAADAIEAVGSGTDTGPDAVEADPETDDAVILDDDSGEEPDRAAGEWPEHDDVRADTHREAPSEPREWPEAEGEDEGFDAELSDGSRADVDFGGGLAPEAASDEEDAEFIESTDRTERGDGSTISPARPSERSQETGDGLGITRAGEPSRSPAADDDEIETEYYCPECGLAEPSSQSSLRPGDICPECRSGYLGEREC